MDIHQLKHFLAVAETGSFLAAAEQLYLSRPAVSKSIAALEKHIGIALFDRHHDGVILTDAGTTMLPKVRETVSSFDSLETDMLALGNQPQTVRIGFTYGVQMVYMDTIARFDESHPNIKIDITQCPIESLPSLLQNGKLDIGCSGINYQDPNMNGFTIGRFEILWGVMNGSEIAERGYILEDEIKNFPHCIPKGGSSLKCDTETILVLNADGTTEPDDGQYDNIFDDNMFYLCKLVEQGKGIIPIAKNVIPKTLNGIIFVPSKKKKRYWELYAYLYGKKQHKTTQMFFDEVFCQ